MTFTLRFSRRVLETIGHVLHAIVVSVDIVIRIIVVEDRVRGVVMIVAKFVVEFIVADAAIVPHIFLVAAFVLKW